MDEALFSTRRANHGIALYNEPRFEWLCQHFDPESAVPSKIRVTDCAAFGAIVGAGIGTEETKLVRRTDTHMQTLSSYNPPSYRPLQLRM